MTQDDAQLFLEEFTGSTAQQFFALAQSGSSRQNFVAQSAGIKYVITANENLAENESFFYFSELFSRLQLNTPQILAIAPDRKFYIQQHLGDQTLSEIIDREGLTERTRALVKSVLEKLYLLQSRTLTNVDYSYTFEYESYDELPITNDLFYFKSFIADVLEIPYHKSTLLQEFKKIVSRLENLKPQSLILRDFQARNIMVNDSDEVYFIDYQAAMRGPLMYDVVSFLFQAKANFPGDFRNEMLSYYFSFWKDDVTVTDLQNSLKPLQLIRYMQVLGAYGFRGLVQKKAHFRKSLNQGITNLYNFSNSWDEMREFPELQKIISELNTEQTGIKIKEILNG
ncbi:aminoglycoside phosphotransferase family protein [Kaistella palustris]|uniref:aminoglycoside phosphotransferase family protein n=1 Tax=Kaistella palustris TaxID=493376 RepID=UPI000427593A|nr:phosphotransferase [Kaistella palustris]